MKNKLPFNPEQYKDRLTLENITTGDCDFCETVACHARRIDLDVFYFCEHHKRLLTLGKFFLPTVKNSLQKLQIAA